ncbi:FxsA family protein [Glaciecola petra]|uniref:FxsA family protein n=1 Tax=Glaciecola petra TaxID=3075602 RepID=A0ABU2ZS36_9ALTE|nr:FxsA family protein [Aestuariibacter sp. P117]MDT0595235.1 FxsA family protein [Aestuariibacter sp. P117]
MLPLFLLFVILPIAEIMLLINVSASIGGWNTFFIVIVTAFFGAYFVRQQGFSLLNTMQTKMASGQAPSSEMAQGLLLLVAGVLLITPGFITDALGFLFTLPFSREPIARFLMSRINFQTMGGAAHQQFRDQQGTEQNHHQSKGDIIDGEYEDKTDADRANDEKNRLN